MNNDTPNNILCVRGLRKSFYLCERDLTIDSSPPLDLDVISGELTALTGPSGVGKSSVVKSIYRTYLPTGGVVYYRDSNGEIVDLATAPESKILELRRGEIRFPVPALSATPVNIGHCRRTSMAGWNPNGGSSRRGEELARPL
jgi:alpha-D-ribose 1-methylphosphonate 5-triphosphate synthase subunit PhnL